MKRRIIIETLAEAIQQIVCHHPLRVAFDGVDASGKTTLANEVARALAPTQRQIIRASVDDFHNPRQIRRAKGSLSPEGFYHDSYNYSALVKFLLDPLGPDGDRHYRKAAFDYRQDQPVNSPVKTAAENAILLIDGIFLLRPSLMPYWDLTIFVDVAFNVTVPRGIKRDTKLFGSHEKAAQRYRERYVPGQRIYFYDAHPHDKANIIIDNNHLEEPDILKMSINSVMT